MIIYFFFLLFFCSFLKRPVPSIDKHHGDIVVFIGFPFFQTLNTNFRRFSFRRSAVGPFSPVAIGLRRKYIATFPKLYKNKNKKKSSFPRYACTQRMEEYGNGADDNSINIMFWRRNHCILYQIVQHDRIVIYIIIIIANNNNDLS